MKVCHYTQFNASGMNRVAESIVEAERKLGIDAVLLNIFEESNWEKALDADVHVAHTHFPDFKDGKSFRRMLKSSPAKIVGVFHGTPEFVFQDSVYAARQGGHGIGDGLQMMYYWLKNADARVTFWPRHQAIYQTLVDRGTTIDLLPLGVDHTFWGGGSCKGRWAGSPSVFSGENPHVIKWPFDLITAWRWIYPQLEGGSLHLAYLGEKLHRHFGSWIYNTGAGYGMHWSATLFSHHNLRDIFKSIDFYVGLVRYGDLNRMSLEANVAGARTISYRGNPHSDYWVTEGDQRELARELLAILRGDVEPRHKAPVPHIEETARGMERIYKRILKRTIVPGFELPFAPCRKWGPDPVVIDLRSPATKARMTREANARNAAAKATNGSTEPQRAKRSTAVAPRKKASPKASRKSR